MKTIAVAVALFVFCACDGFVGEAAVQGPGTSATSDGSLSSLLTSPSSVAAVSSFDPRQITARFEGADEATTANPRMDYRFVLAIINNSEQVITSVRGVTSVRSRAGSDLLLNHPFTASGLRLLPGGTERLSIDLPLASDIASQSTLRFEIVSAETSE